VAPLFEKCADPVAYVSKQKKIADQMSAIFERMTLVE
jgi:hypothetical protein